MRPTPFHSRTSRLANSQSWDEWSGYLSANSYELDHTREYQAVRTAAALFDVSPLHKLLIHGPHAARLLDRVITRDVSRCAIGQVIYTPWCDDEGKVIDDGTLARLDENSFRLTAADPTFAWLGENAFGMEVIIEDVSEGLAALALQGPYAREILNRICTADLEQLGFFRITDGQISGASTTITRTGFTGDLGYEIWLDSAHAERVWDAIMESGEDYRLKPAGTLALDMVRIEAGFLLIDVDYVSARKTMFEIQKSSPYELGMGWLVHLDKPYFVGRDALRRERRRGSEWSTVGLEVDLESLEAVFASFGMPLQLPWGSWNAAVPLYRDHRQIGKATSGTWSPLLKKYIALGRVQRQLATLGTHLEMEVTVEANRRRSAATVVKTPFFDPDRKRA